MKSPTINCFWLPAAILLYPPAEGVDLENVFTLWTIPDADNIKAYVQDHGVNKTETRLLSRLF